MRDMIEWLRVTLDAVEQEANACIAEVGKTRAGEPYADGSGVADRDDFPSYPWGSQARELAFMAGPGHPESVLRQVRAHRAILGQIEAMVTAAPLAKSPAEQAMVGYHDFLGHLVLRRIASIYADRDGFRAEWASHAVDDTDKGRHPSM